MAKSTNQDKKKSKNQIRRERAKLQKQKQSDGPVAVIHSQPPAEIKPSPLLAQDVDEPLKKKRRVMNEEDMKADLEQMYKDVLRKFEPESDHEDDSRTSQVAVLENENSIVKEHAEGESTDERKDVIPSTTDENVSNNATSAKTELSKRQFKKLYTIPLYILKSETNKPELVEWMDANSPDPRLYIYMKTLHNVVSVPSHWNSKRGFLSSKKGIERPPFELPQFIKDTGILEMRQTGPEADEDPATLKQRMRERVQPKAGQLDLDFDILHDAFFKHQKKPPLLKFGECYTESFNNENVLLKEQVSQFRVGVLSRRLKIALGMIDEDGTIKSRVPPWYWRMSEIGPPPSYPHMKIDQNTGVITIKEVTQTAVKAKHWGSLVNDMNTSTKYGKLIQDDDEEEERKEKKKEVSTNSRFDGSKGDVLLKTFGSGPKSSQATEAPKKTNSSTHPERLYQVLQSKDSGDDRSIFGPKTSAYNYKR